MSVATAIAGGKAILNTVLGSSRGSSRADSSSSSSSSSTTTSANLGSTDFIELLLSQLTNQNPLEPMDNSEMVTQLAQFEMVNKMDSLDESVNAMMLYQNMMSSVDMMGKEVTVIDPESGEEITGVVDSIKMQNGFPQVVINDTSYDVAYITDVK